MKDDKLENLPRYNLVRNFDQNTLRLDLNENLLGCSEKIVDKLRNLNTDLIAKYPDYSSIYSKLSEYFDLPVSNLLLTNGLDEAIKLIFETLTFEKSNYILPIPTFSMYEIFGISSNCIKIKLNADLSFPLDQLLSFDSNQIDLIVLVNPNNPTGTSIGIEDISTILRKFKNSLVVIDEAYIEFGGTSCIPLISQYKNLIVLRTFSKAYGLAGLRCGIVLTQNPIIDLIRCLIPPFSVNSIATSVLEIALSDFEFIQNYVETINNNRILLTNFFEDNGFSVLNTKGNFILCNFGNLNDYINRTLKKSNIIIKNLTEKPLLQNCSRITIGSIAQMQQLILSLTDILSRPAILFDMDGVLVDVSNSYRQTILQTVNKYLANPIQIDLIDQIKAQPGSNNDWEVVIRILNERGIIVSNEVIIQEFQDIYLGNKNREGLILNENWIFPLKELSKLRDYYRIGIVTGRPKKEAEFTLTQNLMLSKFDVIITMEDCPPGKLKPNPYGLKKAMELIGVDSGWYLGDSPDDISAAKNAKLIPIGVSVCNKINKSNLTKFGATSIITDYDNLGGLFL